MAKKLMAAVLGAVLALALLPTLALAAGATVTLGGVPLPSGSYYVNGTGGAAGTVSPTEPSSWHAHYDGTTLYLNGFVLTNYTGQYGIIIDGGSATLDLAGTSTLSLAGPAGLVSPIALCFRNGDTLTVQGTGSLTATVESAATDVAGVWIEGPRHLTMKSGTLTCKVAGAPDPQNGTPRGIGIVAMAGTIAVEGGTLIGQPIDAVNGKNCYGGINCKTLSVSGGTLSGEGYQCGIYAADGMRISGGNVTGVCNGANSGIGCPRTDGRQIVISGGVVRGDCTGTNITGGGNGTSGNVVFSGGDALFTGKQRRYGAVNNSLTLSGDSAQYAVTTSTAYTDNPAGSYDPAQLHAYQSLHVTLAYGVALESPAGTALTAHTFPAQTERYGAGSVPPLVVTVKNAGAQPTGELAIAFSDGDSSAFTLPSAALSSIAAGGTASFNANVVPGLAPNSYNATVTVSPARGNGNPVAPRSFTVQFTVNPLVLTIVPLGGAIFPAGGAIANAEFLISANEPLTAAANYHSATLDGQPLDLGDPDGAPGADGSVTTGSIQVTVNQSRLNTLGVGTYPLTITLKDGLFADKTVTGTITVTAPAVSSAPVVPKTGDGTPLIGLALLALLSCGGAALLLTRKKHAKRFDH